MYDNFVSPLAQLSKLTTRTGKFSWKKSRIFISKDVKLWLQLCYRKIKNATYKHWLPQPINFA